MTDAKDDKAAADKQAAEDAAADERAAKRAADKAEKDKADADAAAAEEIANRPNCETCGNSIPRAPFGRDDDGREIKVDAWCPTCNQQLSTLLPGQ